MKREPTLKNPKFISAVDSVRFHDYDNSMPKCTSKKELLIA